MDDSKYIVFEHVGYRQARRGEQVDFDGAIRTVEIGTTESKYDVYQRIPADRVEVAVKPEPEAYTVSGERGVFHHNAYLFAACDRENAMYAVDVLNKLARRIRELEGQVNRG